MTAILCFVVFASAITIDFAHARCIVAIGERAGQRAALWSLVQWTASTIGILIAFKVTLWVLPFEASGLYVGTLLAVRPRPRKEPSGEREDLLRTAPWPRLKLVRASDDYRAAA